MVAFSRHVYKVNNRKMSRFFLRLFSALRNYGRQNAYLFYVMLGERYRRRD